MRKFINEELQIRYENDPIFKKRIERSEKEYSNMLSKASEKQTLIPEEILQRFFKEGNEAIYFFYGYLQPPAGSSTSELTMAFLKFFQPEHDERFTFVYFNNETPSSDNYFQFKKIFALLPLRIVEHLRQFILVQPTFYIKAYDYLGLGSINRIFSSRYRTVENCTQLLDHLKIPVKDFVTFVPEEISAQFPKIMKRRPSLLSYRVNLEGQNMTEQQKKEKNQFQMAISAFITKDIYKLQNYELGDIGIPVIIQLLIHYFRTKPAGLDEEGIFRKSVSIDQENETLNELSKRNYQYLQQIKNPHLIASLIKRFFSNLKEPIITYSIYEALIHDQGVKDKKEHVKKLLKTLPELNFITLAFLIEFLKKDVLPHEKNSKMSANNLSICFSPSLMRSEKPSMADLINASKAVTITNILISDFEDIFGSEQERQILYKKNVRSRDRNFKENIKKELDIAPNEHQEEYGYSISITEPSKVTPENQTHLEQQMPQQYNSKQSQQQNHPNTIQTTQELKNVTSKQEKLKSEPPQAAELKVQVGQVLRAKSQEKKSEKSTEKINSSKILGEAFRGTIRFSYASKQDETKRS